MLEEDSARWMDGRTAKDDNNVDKHGQKRTTRTRASRFLSYLHFSEEKILVNGPISNNVPLFVLTSFFSPFYLGRRVMRDNNGLHDQNS